MKHLSFDELKEKIQQRFPDLIVRDGAQFYCDSTKEKTSLWLPNAEEVTYTNKDHNTLYRANLSYNKNYDLEVYNKFDKWCNCYGWYVSTESYTMQVFKL